eukprot:COSAG01_NODE_13_length_41723_cov_145.394556_36_plen_219_part_00
MVQVWFNAHKANQGRLVLASELEYMDFSDGRRAPVVYVARNGHGHYPHAGTTCRVSCLANDTTDQGLLWQPRAAVRGPLSVVSASERHQLQHACPHLTHRLRLALFGGGAGLSLAACAWLGLPVVAGSGQVLPDARDTKALLRRGASWLLFGGALGTARSVADWRHCSHEEQRESPWRVMEVGGVPCGIATKKWWVQDQNEWRSMGFFARLCCLCMYR